MELDPKLFVPDPARSRQIYNLVSILALKILDWRTVVSNRKLQIVGSSTGRFLFLMDYKVKKKLFS